MCGIVGYKGSKDAFSILISGLKKLEYRGYDSAGVAIVYKNKIYRYRKKGKVKQLEDEFKDKVKKTTIGIAHTRWATHGNPSEENAHPHSDCKRKIAVVHNGIIENYIEIKSKLKKRGHRFNSQTDTEVIPHLIEENLKKLTPFEAILETVNELKGSFAFLTLFSEHPELIVGVRKNSPLIFGKNENEFFFSSDVLAISDYLDELYFPDEETIIYVSSDRFSFFNFKGVEKRISPKKIDNRLFFIEKKGFKHFMLKEIFEQSEAVRETVQQRYSLETGEIFFEDILPQEISSIEIIASGTSYHAGCIGEIFFEEISKIRAQTHISSEFSYRKIIPDDNTLYIAISQSGETADTLKAIEKIKEKNGFVLSITNTPESRITRETDSFILTHSGPEISVAATKTFTSQVALLYLLSLYIGKNKGNLSKKEIIKKLKNFQKIPVLIDITLNLSREIERISRYYYQKNAFLYIGRWINYPVALEGALKLKEISYIYAQAYPGGELKHGPISLIEEETPVVVIAPKDRVNVKTLSNIEEAKARGANIISIGTKTDGDLQSLSDVFLPLPETDELLSPLISVIPLQLLSYYIALRKGVDIDQPRNLAKSVTVE